MPNRPLYFEKGEHDFAREVGSNLSFCRKQKGFSQPKFAPKVGLTTGASISMIENGNAKMSLWRSLRVCQELGITLEELLEGVVDRSLLVKSSDNVLPFSRNTDKTSGNIRGIDSGKVSRGSN